MSNAAAGVVCQQAGNTGDTEAFFEARWSRTHTRTLEIDMALDVLRDLREELLERPVAPAAYWVRFARHVAVDLRAHDAQRGREQADERVAIVVEEHGGHLGGRGWVGGRLELLERHRVPLVLLEAKLALQVQIQRVVRARLQDRRVGNLEILANKWTGTSREQVLIKCHSNVQLWRH